MKNPLSRARSFEVKSVEFPNIKVAKGEKLVATLPDELTRFWGLLDFIAKPAVASQTSINQEIERALMEHDREHALQRESVLDSCKGHHAHIRGLKDKFKEAGNEARILTDIFWQLVRLHFGLFEEKHLGLREGGKVVILPKEKVPAQSFRTGIQIVVIASGMGMQSYDDDREGGSPGDFLGFENLFGRPPR